MNILHIVHGYPPSIGGSQWLVKSISEELVNRYHDEVTVFTTVAYNTEYFWNSNEPAMSPCIEVINGVTVRRFPVFNRLGTLRALIANIAYRLRLPYNDHLRTLQNGPLIFGLKQAVAQSKVDIILATAFPLMHMYDAVAGARQGGIPIVLLGAIHTANAWGYDRPMIYRAIQQANAYIAHTTFERDHLIQHGINARKIAVIGAGVTANRFISANGSSLREKYGWEQAPVVATIGKQSFRKRFDVLVAAMCHIWREHPEVHLLIAGGRSVYTPILESLIADLPPEQRAQVTLYGDFTEEEKSKILSACDIFVLPSGEESFGIAFIEAWACGKPVIGSRIGAIPAVIAEGQDGLLATYGDANDLAGAILELIENPQRRLQLGKTGQNKVLQNYTWETITSRLREVYIKTIATSTKNSLCHPHNKKSAL